MHGLIFAEMQKYAETKHGKGTWQALLKKAGLETKVYLTIQEYPDAEVVALVVAASSMTGRSLRCSKISGSSSYPTL